MIIGTCTYDCAVHGEIFKTLCMLCCHLLNQTKQIEQQDLSLSLDLMSKVLLHVESNDVL